MLGLTAGAVDILYFLHTAQDLSLTTNISTAHTPLMLAAEENRPDVVRALLLHGAHVDATSRQTALISHRLSFQTDTRMTGMAIHLSV